MTFYILKIKGIAKIPDYVQVRDADFMLIAYFRLDRISNGIAKIKFIKEKEQEISECIEELPFGLIKKICLNND
ncbi:MAG: fructose-6-phosphate aldolase [Solitalea-like symbiont of Tyrophagus putrescentiae]